MTFHELKKMHKAMEALDSIRRASSLDLSAASLGARYIEKEKFTQALKDFMREDWAKGLKKMQLLEFLSWCSTFRPREPHSILTSVSIQFDRIKEGEKDNV